jgi:hypothetical protein
VTPTEYSTPSLIVTARQLLRVVNAFRQLRRTRVLLGLGELCRSLSEVDDDSVFQSGGTKE